MLLAGEHAQFLVGRGDLEPRLHHPRVDALVSGGSRDAHVTPGVEGAAGDEAAFLGVVGLALRLRRRCAVVVGQCVRGQATQGQENNMLDRVHIHSLDARHLP